MCFIKLFIWSCCLMITLHNFPMRCDHSCIVGAPECRLKSPTMQRYFTGSQVQAWCLRRSVKNPVLRIQEVQASFSDVLHKNQTDYSLNYFPRPSQLVAVCFQILSFENFRAPLLMIWLFLAWKQCIVLLSCNFKWKKKCVSVAYVVLMWF